MPQGDPDRASQSSSALRTQSCNGEFDGRQYLVTEFIGGGTLSDWVRRQARSCDEIAELLAALLIAAVAWALVSRGKQTSSVTRLEFVPLTSFTDSAVAPALSPDRRMLAFIRGNSTFTGRGDVYINSFPTASRFSVRTTVAQWLAGFAVVTEAAQ